MNRLLEIPADQLVAGRGRILGPYKIWIHSPTVAAGMEHIGTFLNKRSSLSTREVELCILIIAQHWDGEYVKQAHIKAGKAAGLTQEQIDAILAGRDPKLTDPHEQAVHRFAVALVNKTNGIAEVLVLLGYYTSVALGMKVHEVPIPAA
jgi:4-carboxymuconolactone decarboxylase